MQLLNQLEKPSPNLIKDSSSLGSSAEAKVSELLVKADKIVLFVIEAVLVGLVLFNIKLSNDLKAIEADIRSKNPELIASEAIEEDARKFKSGIDSFKQVKALNPKIQSEIELIYQRTPQEVVVKNLVYQPGDIKLTLSTPKSEYFAKLVASYFDSKAVSQITLETASLISEKEEYLFVVDIQTKGTK